MKRHLLAYIIVVAIYCIPKNLLDLNPEGEWYFVSIGCWSTISMILYIRFIKLRCATLLAWIEVVVTVCASIALIEFTLKHKNGYFYTNIELLTDMFVILEILIITSSLIGTTIGHLGHNRYNTRGSPNTDHRANII